jgi:hypothetical protein
VAVGILLAQHLRRKLGYPSLDCEAHEEENYGLPEFSVYNNQDSRSFCGKWTYSENPENMDESGVFFALINSDHLCYGKIEETISTAKKFILIHKGFAIIRISTSQKAKGHF